MPCLAPRHPLLLALQLELSHDRPCQYEGEHLAACLSVYPSQSGIEIQPSSRYTLPGLEGMFEVRSPALLHTAHSL